MTLLLPWSVILENTFLIPLWSQSQVVLLIAEWCRCFDDILIKKGEKKKPQREIGKLLPYGCVLYFCFHRWRQTGVLQRFFKNICNSCNSLTSCSIERIPKLPESTDSAIFSSTAPQRRRLVERRESEGRKRRSSTENRTFYLFSFDLLGFFFVVFFFFFLFSVLFAKYWMWALLGITVMTFISLKRTVSAGQTTITELW